MDTNRPSDQDFPGGGVDAGEEIIAGVAREIFEEAGLVVPAEDLVLFYTKTEIMHDENVIRLLFFCHVSNPIVLLSHEHDDFHWATPEQALLDFPHRVYGAGLEYGLNHKLFSVSPGA
jgi:8-oxo-dGTP pyrophosphatase MutT (NUDIX family)